LIYDRGDFLAVDFQKLSPGFDGLIIRRVIRLNHQALSFDSETKRKEASRGDLLLCGLVDRHPGVAAANLCERFGNYGYEFHSGHRTTQSRAIGSEHSIHLALGSVSIQSGMGFLQCASHQIEVSLRVRYREQFWRCLR